VDLDQRLDDLAPLAEPVRRALYLHVSRQAEPTGRDAAASALGVSRALAAFHLDRLVEAGLLVAEYRRLTGRSGPGAGRPAKVYRRADRQIEVSLPERRYDVAAQLFARAVAQTGTGEPVEATLHRAARDYGEALGVEARRRAGPRPPRARLRAAGGDVLQEHGFEPAERAADGPIVLRNCPFDALVRDHRDLVCGMNLSLMEGVLAGLRLRGLSAQLDPQPGRCCVVWTATADGPGETAGRGGAGRDGG
jgi:predicted ArsR family transcriptional regulator